MVDWFTMTQTAFNRGDRPMMYEMMMQRNVILMQYTGLKDKNGKEIYEGDIIVPGYGVDETLELVYDIKKARFAGRRRGSEYADKEILIMDGSLIRRKGIEVIGNIYENPNLIKEAQ